MQTNTHSSAETRRVSIDRRPSGRGLAESARVPRWLLRKTSTRSSWRAILVGATAPGREDLPSSANWKIAIGEDPRLGQREGAATDKGSRTGSRWWA